MLLKACGLTAISSVLVILFSISSVAQVPCNTRQQLYQDALQADSYQKKAALYRQLVKKCPNFSEAHNNLADALENLGQYDMAIRHYELAIKANPNLDVAYFGQGDVYFKTGQYEKAIEAYTKGLYINPADRLAIEGLKKAEQKISLYNDATIISSDKIVSELTDSPISLMGPGGIRHREARIRFNNILFDLNSASLKPVSAKQLHEVGKALRSKRLSTKSFVIEGHTDSTGDADYNLKLSEDRALSVLNYLIRHFNLDPNKFLIRGFGEFRPLAGNHIPSGRSLNRRVEILAISN
jgi:outer membrane protein OmpA-like peptidoglycan-associated protein